MWNLTHIHFTNLFSHADSEYTFRAGQCTVIIGENRTDARLDNNGAGKTTLFEAIVLALTGEPLRAVRKDGFIRRGTTTATVDLALENPATDYRVRIRRGWYAGGKSATASLEENGEDNGQLTSVAEVNKRIFELLGITKDDLLHYFIVGQDSHYSFFTATDGDKKEILNRVTNADIVLPLLDELKRRGKEAQAEADRLERTLAVLQSRKETYEDQIAELLNPVGVQREIADRQHRIDSLREQIATAQQEEQRAVAEFDRLKTALDGLTVPDVGALEKEANTVRNDIATRRSEQIQGHNVAERLELILGGQITCPACGAHFAAPNDMNLTLDDATALLKEQQEENDRTAHALSALRTHLDTDLTPAIQAAAQLQAQYRDLDTQVHKTNFTVAEARHRVRQKEEEIADQQKKIQDLQTGADVTAHTAVLQQKIEQTMSDLKSTTEAAARARASVEMIRYWTVQLGKTGFQTYLANRAVRVVQGAVNGVLTRFGVDLRVDIAGYAVNADGSVRERIDVTVSGDGGVTSEPYMAKSGGERGRVALAGIIALQETVNATAPPGGGLNLLVLDEVFPGMDSAGQGDILRVLERAQDTVLLITQGVDTGTSFPAENLLRVVKEGGVSKYVPL